MYLDVYLLTSAYFSLKYISISWINPLLTYCISFITMLDETCLTFFSKFLMVFRTEKIIFSCLVLEKKNGFFYSGSCSVNACFYWLHLNSLDKYSMRTVNSRVLFNTFRTEILVASYISAKVGNRLLFMEVARHIVFKVGLHVIDVKGFSHLLRHFSCYWLTVCLYLNWDIVNIEI